MDISTGHMVLSYMEDHLKNKQRLEQEWVGLCAYEAEPNSTSIAFKVNLVNSYFLCKIWWTLIEIFQMHSRTNLSGHSTLWSLWIFPPKLNLFDRFQQGNLFEYGFNQSNYNPILIIVLI